MGNRYLRLACVIIATPLPVLAHPGHDESPPAAPPVGAVTRSVQITTDGEYRYVTSNGLPDHPTGQFPGRGNPNAISAQDYKFRMPLHPKPAQQGASTELRRGVFGVALNGVVFDPGTAEFWKDDPSLGWRMEAIGGPRNLGLDSSNAHVQPNGAYHYHGIPIALAKALSAGKLAKGPVLLGYAADGYPIYGPTGYSEANDAKSAVKELKPSYKLKEGSRPADGPPGKYDGAYTRDWEYVAGSGDLDEHNGRSGVTPEYPEGTYYYVLTDSFPFVPRSFHGTPDSSFNKQGPPGPGPRRQRGGGPPGPR